MIFEATKINTLLNYELNQFLLLQIFNQPKEHNLFSISLKDKALEYSNLKLNFGNFSNNFSQLEANFSFRCIFKLQQFKSNEEKLISTAQSYLCNKAQLQSLNFTVNNQFYDYSTKVQQLNSKKNVLSIYSEDFGQNEFDKEVIDDKSCIFQGNFHCKAIADASDSILHGFSCLLEDFHRSFAQKLEILNYCKGNSSTLDIPTRIFTLVPSFSSFYLSDYQLSEESNEDSAARLQELFPAPLIPANVNFELFEPPVIGWFFFFFLFLIKRS